jgi:hypothetical protein
MQEQTVYSCAGNTGIQLLSISNKRGKDPVTDIFAD